MKSAATTRELFAPYAAYRAMRSDKPVFRDTQFHAWHVYRYADVERVLTDHDTFRSNLAERTGQTGRRPAADPGRDTMLRADPPRHRQLRGLVSTAFTARVVDRMLPRISRITDDMLDRVLSRGAMDVVADLAYPLPVIVIAELLGIPPDRREDFKRWSDAVIAGGYETPEPEADDEVAGMHAYFSDVLDERRRRPGDDLISELLAAEVEGRRLTMDELVNFCGMMLVAGHETTTNLIGNAVLCVEQRPELLDRLRKDPTVVPPMLEEVLRYLSPVQIVVRFAATDTVLADQPIRAGELVFPVIGSANRDEAEFCDPDRFDVDRTPNRHLAFGHGIHFCLGASLARLEARIALAAMLERLPGHWEVPDVSLDPLALRFLFGVRRLPLEWER